MSEKSIMHEIMRAVSTIGARVFRNHVGGVAYQGEAHRFTAMREIKVLPGDVLIRKARTVRVGLHTGSSDLIGWDQRGRFLAIEVKHETGLSPEQQQFIDVVNNAGGIAIVAHGADEAVRLLTEGKS